ncbi:hypothetical protein CONPUDRAFT_79543 [Coniophora puteana RWD-64-598 SS2]|uniref:Uncharacterized protein n=1 Tax=Coniophora puteana (strain RWD-64-598) TaxID=741705 RepID=A0A5M3N1I0_CONPW|nr:uncharacterized protein CONPUDRAFT_79543 [Coniophora puteana RWD-64-598 SS2]EIW84731.1 hypothetical protein CONPUDRAFT_79543 [Coniophora puteana RWD-64-598 SS2]
MGAPPVENGSKKTGELYANRIQGLGKPSSRPTSPELLDGQPKQRSSSSFAAVGEEPRDGTVSPPPKAASTTPSRSNSLIPPVDLATMRSVSSPDIPQARDLTLDPGAAKVSSPPPAAESDGSPAAADVPSTPVGASSGDAPTVVLAEEPQETSSEPTKASSESTPTTAAASLPAKVPTPAPAAAPVAPTLAPITKPITSVSPAPPSPIPELVKPPSGPSQTVVRNVTRTTSPPAQFSAVVHRKVAEPTPPPSSTTTSTLQSQIVTPKAQRARVPVTVETPSSPAVELAALLENAFLLEARLGEPGSSSDSQSLKTPTADSFPAGAGLPPPPRIAEPDLMSTPTPKAPGASVGAGAGAGASEGEEKALSPKQSIGSFSERSIPSIREPAIDQDIPEEGEPDFGAQSIRSYGGSVVSGGNGAGDASERASVRSKGSTTRHYFSSLRRIASGASGSSRRSSTYNGARDSMSFSSEDSGVVVTPPSDGAAVQQWPTARKGSVGRSSSFADKLFNRSKGRSNQSGADNQSVHSYGSSLTPSLSSKSARGKSAHGKAATDSEAVRSSKFDLDAFPSVPGSSKNA